MLFLFVFFGLIYYLAAGKFKFLFNPLNSCRHFVQYPITVTEETLLALVGNWI